MEKKRKDYLYLPGEDVDLTKEEISYDFSDQKAEIEYCLELAENESPVILINNKYQREAVVTTVNNGVVTFRLTGF